MTSAAGSGPQEWVGYHAGVAIPPDVMARARLLLAHAAVQRVADARGLDVLHIKGHAVDPSLRWPGRVGTDVDVLVRPRHVDSLLAGLLESGWAWYTDFESGSAFEHAATLVHETWGYVDLHRYFPGIGAPAPAAFDTLWNDRSVANLAGVACPVPNITAQILVLVLHAAPLANRMRGGRDIQAAFDAADRARQAAVLELVEELRAEVAFAAAVGGLDQYRDRPEYAFWRIQAEGGTRIEEWRARVAAAPSLRAKAHLVLRAPLVNTAHLAHVLGRPPTRWEIVKEFGARPVRGVREEWRVRRARRRAPLTGRHGARPVGRALPDPAGPGERAATAVAPAEDPQTGAASPATDTPVGAFVRPDDVGAHAEEVAVFTARLPGGPLHILEGVAGVIWEEAVAGDREGLVQRVADRTGAEVEEVRSDVEAFLEDLVGHRLLRESVESG